MWPPTKLYLSKITKIGNANRSCWTPTLITPEFPPHIHPLSGLSISEMQNINDKQQLLRPNFIERCHKLRRRDGGCLGSHTHVSRLPNQSQSQPQKTVVQKASWPREGAEYVSPSHRTTKLRTITIALTNSVVWGGQLSPLPLLPLPLPLALTLPSGSRAGDPGLGSDRELVFSSRTLVRFGRAAILCQNNC